MSKFDDIKPKKKKGADNTDKKALEKIINGGQVEIKPDKTPEIAEKRVPIQFRLPPDIRAEIKAEAATRKLTMHELFMEMYEDYKEKKKHESMKA